MKRRLTVLLTVFFALFGCQQSRSNAEAKELDSAIRRELPQGTTKRAVLAFLDQHKIPHEDSRDISYYTGPRRVWGGRTPTPGLTVTDVILTFDFDENDRLVSYKMEKRTVGP